MKRVNTDIVGNVQKYLGIPYLHAGRTRNGLDCLGLAALIYHDFDIPFPDDDGRPYSPEWVYEDPERYLRGILRYGKIAPLNQLEPLDFLYFRIGKYISHSGVAVDPTHFIHVMQNRPVHISPLDEKWRQRLAGARRLI